LLPDRFNMELDRLTQLSWKKFLSTEAGQRGLAFLRYKAPGIQKGDSHHMIYDGGVNQGYAKCLDRINEITEDQQKEVKEDNS
jgi:hypothetical protein